MKAIFCKIKKLLKLIVTFCKNLFIKFDFGKYIHYSSGNIEVKNVIDPIIKFSIFLALPISLALFILGCFFNKDYLIITGIIITILDVFFFFTQYRFFAKKDPDRLQSEKYLLESKRIDIESQKNNKRIIVNQENLIEDKPIDVDEQNLNLSLPDEEDTGDKNG